MQGPIILVLVLNHNYRHSPLFFQHLRSKLNADTIQRIFVITSLDNINEANKRDKNSSN